MRFQDPEGGGSTTPEFLVPPDVEMRVKLECAIVDAALAWHRQNMRIRPGDAGLFAAIGQYVQYLTHKPQQSA
jgi:hypothetical protein